MPPTTKNLKPWKKGQSGNPKGRPVLPNLRETLAKVLAEEQNGLSAIEAICRALRVKAIRGDVRAAEALLDRAFGKVAQSLDVTSAGHQIVTPPILWSDQIPSE